MAIIALRQVSRHRTSSCRRRIMTRAILGLSWTDIPTHMLRAELLRRQANERPVCGTKGGRGSYNTPLHVFALFLILALSTAGTCLHDLVVTEYRTQRLSLHLACSFPIVVKRFPRFPVP